MEIVSKDLIENDLIIKQVIELGNASKITLGNYGSTLEGWHSPHPVIGQ